MLSFFIHPPLYRLETCCKFPASPHQYIFCKERIPLCYRKMQLVSACQPNRQILVQQRHFCGVLITSTEVHVMSSIIAWNVYKREASRNLIAITIIKHVFFLIICFWLFVLLSCVRVMTTVLNEFVYLYRWFSSVRVWPSPKLCPIANNI